MSQNCIFCQILDGELPSYKIYEDDHTIAFLNIYPSVKGHVLLISKKHGEQMFDFSTEELKNIMSGIEQVTRQMQEVLKPDGFNIGWNHGEHAGQSVPHLHVHIMPRWQGDGDGSVQSFIKNPGETEVKDVFELFQ